jgi:hypothetical protein
MKNYQTSTRRAGTTGRTTAGKVKKDAARAAEEAALVLPERVELACRRALEAEAVNVNLIARMIERATEAEPTARPPQPTPIRGRFARDTSEFTVGTEVSK